MFKGKKLVGVGVYSAAEAARLTHVSRPRIRRWVKGYSYGQQSSRRESPALWLPTVPQIEGDLTLGFRDLMEIRFVDAFLRAGVSWRFLRLAAQKAATLFDTSHPFSQRCFKTDGHAVFVATVNQTGRSEIWDLVSDQIEFERIITPFLRGIDFVNEAPARWWPEEGRGVVVLDPERAFGQPIVSEGAVPTAALHAAFLVEQSISAVAKWFDIAPSAVDAAVDYERALAA